MSLSYIDITNVRNIEHQSLQFSDKLNFIVGDNASGKTTLLEAIYLLSRGKSFRSKYNRKIIRHSSDALTVFALTALNEANHKVGLQISEGKLNAKVDGKLLKKRSVLASVLPLLLITPDGDRIITSSPRQRRRLLDWGLFHVEQSYLSVWSRYNRVLTQRNAALRINQISEVWDSQFIQAALQLDEARKNYVQKLIPLFTKNSTHLTGLKSIELGYKQGWSKEATLEKAISDSVVSDKKMGFSQKGPHRSDLAITIDGKNASETLSGGQKKLIAVALLLAQAQLFSEINREKCLLLIDDLPSELDETHRKRFLTLVESINCQAIITTTSLKLIDDEQLPQAKVFHVEHGHFKSI